MNTEEQIYTYRVTRKIRTGGSSAASFILGLLGVVMLISPAFILGVILIVVACLVGVKTGYVSSCGHCGNQVSHTSTLCPVCHADLAPEPPSMLQIAWYLALAIAVAAAVLTLLWRVMH